MLLAAQNVSGGFLVNGPVAAELRVSDAELTEAPVLDRQDDSGEHAGMAPEDNAYYKGVLI